jgi:hypothetical protein
MKKTMWCAVVVLGLLGSRVVAGTPCEAVGGPSLVTTRDESGYSVVADWTDEFWRPRRGTRINKVCDWLASEAHVTVLYASENTERDIPRGHFSGNTPLEAVRALCDAAGLQVLTPSPRLWVIDKVKRDTDLSITVFCRRLSLEKSWLENDEQADLEMAILNQLPIRTACVGLADCFMGIGYLPLPDAKTPTLLVQAMLPVGLAGHAPTYAVYKIAVERGDSGFNLRCLWACPVSGPIVPEVDEDLDGDGFRDFVFSVDDYEDAMDSAVSGLTGATLFEFSGRELVVEQDSVGPKRVAVERVWVGIGDERQEPKLGPAVLVFSESDSGFRVQPNLSGSTAGTTMVPVDSATAKDPGDGLVRLLRSGSGQPSRIKRFLLREPGAVTHTDGEQIVTVRRGWLERVTPAMVSEGLPARILFQVRLAAGVPH